MEQRMRLIPLTKDKFTLVDDADYAFLNQKKWHCTNGGYAARTAINAAGKVKLLFMHREILNTPAGLYTDHINGNKLDNRRENLRICTISENSCNRGKQNNNKSGYKGVYWHKASGKWQAMVGLRVKYIYLGLFDDIDDAARAYNLASNEYHGKFAKLNLEE